MSWKPEIEVDGEFQRNQLVFETREEAVANARDLFSVWRGCTNHRAVEVAEPVNYRYVNGELQELQPVPVPVQP